MTDHDDLRLSLGSYLVGALDPAARAVIDSHLRDCVDCRDELHQFSGLPGLLSRLDADQLHAGVDVAPKSLLEGLLAQALPIEMARRQRLHRWRSTSVVLSAAAVLIGVLMVPSIIHAKPLGKTYQLQAASATAPVTGSVTLVTKPWGTELMVSMKHLPAGSSCIAVVTGLSGAREIVSHWGPTASHAAQVVFATDMKVANIAHLTVQTSAGRVLLVRQLAV